MPRWPSLLVRLAFLIAPLALAYSNELVTLSDRRQGWGYHLVYKVAASLNGFAFFRFPRAARFCDSDGRCRLVRWWMLSTARWLKNGAITYLSHGQGKQGV